MYLKVRISDQRILRLDMLAFHSDEKFDEIFSQIWQLSKEGITTPAGTRRWLYQRRVGEWLRHQLLTTDSPIIGHLREAMATDELQVTPLELVDWFRLHLASEARKTESVSSLDQVNPRVDQLIGLVVCQG